MNHKTTLLGVLIAGLIFAAGAPAEETMYKWIDADGAVHYGEIPPEGVDAKPVSIRGATVRSPNPGGSSAAADSSITDSAEKPKSLAQQRRDERAEKAQEARERDEMLKVSCANQRQKLADLMPRPRVIVQEDDGTTRRLDDQERLDMIAEAQEYVDENCADY